ncbi:MAG TPA: DNA polymerase I [Lactobacillaceae bacterium]
MAKTLLLIDGNSLAFRAFYAMYNQLDRMISHTGLHTNALVAFNNFLDQIVDPMQPDLALVAWDAASGKSTFRGELFDGYKDGRSKAPEEFREQFPYLREMVTHHGLTSYELPGFEADDIIGTLARQGEAAGYDVTIVTGDKDLTQLTTDKITVNVTIKGVTEIERYTPAHVHEKFGLTPDQIIDMKALTGDTSDNYPGVTKVGEKTAVKLLTEFGTLDNLYAHVADMKTSKMKENLINDREQAYRAQKLATIETAAPLTLSLDDIAYTGVDYDALIPFYQDLDFKKELAKIHALQASGQIANGADDVPEVPVMVFTPLTAEVALPDFGDEVAFYLALDSESYHSANVIGFAIGNAKVGYFAARSAELLDLVAPILADEKITKRVFNAKATWVALQRFSIDLTAVTFDFLLAAYLLDTTDNDNELATLAARFDVMLQDDVDIYGKGAKFAVPADDVLLPHLAAQAAAIFKLEEPVLAALAEHEQLDLYREMELPLAFVLARMEKQGFAVDRETLVQMGEDLTLRLDIVIKNIYAAAGREFNLNSPKQLAEVLFEELKLPTDGVKKNKSGYSTAVDVLEKLAPQAPIVDDILTYRQLAKLQSTYIEGLLAVIHDDGKIHTRFLQTLTQTGRLSSVDPNLQNIPMRLEEGRRIRQAFVPSQAGWQIFGADYSQIELRVLAHVTGDKNLQAAFLHDEDIHAATARAVFGLGPDDEVDALHRRTAKAVNFGIVYGISDFGLANNLGITRYEAKQFIETYFAEYPQVHEWMETIKKVAHERGYVETLAHRRRYLPDIHAKNFNLRSFAERTAMNSPIQGSAADIIKIAMLKVDEALREAGLQARLLLQVHDELIFEAPADEIDELAELIPAVMDSAVALDVPLKVEPHWGANWYRAK